MDVLSLLAAIVAVALFPGGAYAAAVAGGALAGGRLPPARVPWSSVSVAAAVLLLFAAALVPLPGSPAAVLPLQTGAAANLLGALLLLGGGLALGTPARWTRARLAAGVAALAPLLVLAASAATLDFPVVVALPGRELAAARALAAAALLLAIPVLGRLADAEVPRGLRALHLAVPALVAAVLLAPPGWSGLPAAVAAALVFGGVVIYAVPAVLLSRLPRGGDAILAGMATATSIASICLVALATR
jgi:hypothetical protein